MLELDDWYASESVQPKSAAAVTHSLLSVMGCVHVPDPRRKYPPEAASQPGDSGGEWGGRGGRMGGDGGDGGDGADGGWKAQTHCRVDEHEYVLVGGYRLSVSLEYEDTLKTQPGAS